MISTTVLELDNSNADPLDRILTAEFIEGTLKAGSLISMLENKKINVTTLFLLILEDKNYQEFFIEMTSSKNIKEAVLSLLFLYPSLVKSKFTKSYIRKVNGQKNKRIRKSSLQ